ncbi:uncharacterized protein IUM83_10457 [Phytophthora cinnamomi]|uniref:uncharacterized protein n=1 Tax=Phytophthora cinnamomi TaxID=4785 RepID=UPI003559EC73|nr:hypothetical protein IUM83_10457 [Phytophthora cinnamomi]
MMSKRPISSNVSPANDAKRRRSGTPQDQQHEPAPIAYPRLEAARFPPAILALPHILKQIDVCLMTDEEALMEAARTGLTDWLDDLLPDVDDGSVASAVLEASRHGHVDCVELLIDEYKYAERGLGPYTYWENLLKAVEAAAINGHLDVLKLLLGEASPVPGDLRKGELCGSVHGALLVAAEGGHLDVVKFMVQYAKEQDFCAYDLLFHSSTALARAISGGQTAVVEYLLGLEEFTWDLQKAFVAAVGVKDNSLADRMYELFVQTSKKEELFIELACGGYLDAVKYLYETGHNDSDMIGEAFVGATQWRGNDALEFLLSTGRVSSEAFDRGFEKAVVSSWDGVNVVPFLLEKKRASAKSINQAFVASSSSDILEILLERANILDESIRNVFERAMGGLCEYYSKREKEEVRIIKLLYAKVCIPAEMIGRALVAAASKGHSELVALLRGDDRISAEMVGEAFAGAATRKNSDLMMSLYNSGISPDTILVAFAEAACRKRIRNVKELVKLLSNPDLVPPEFKHKAFVIAARLDHDTVLQLLCESGNDLWPLTTLKVALAVSKQDEVKHFIRKVICDQLFDPKCPWAR